MSTYLSAWEAMSGHGVSVDRFEESVEELELGRKWVDMLFEGLSLETVIRRMRKGQEDVQAGFITQAKLRFLDTWETEEQLQEEWAWEQMAKRKVTILSPWDNPRPTVVGYGLRENGAGEATVLEE